MYTHTHTHTHTRARAHTHTHTHTHIHTHTNTQVYIYIVLCSLKGALTFRKKEAHKKEGTKKKKALTLRCRFDYHRLD